MTDPDRATPTADTGPADEPDQERAWWSAALAKANDELAEVRADRDRLAAEVERLRGRTHEIQAQEMTKRAAMDSELAQWRQRYADAERWAHSVGMTPNWAVDPKAQFWRMTSWANRTALLRLVTERNEALVEVEALRGAIEKARRSLGWTFDLDLSGEEHQKVSAYLEQIRTALDHGAAPVPVSVQPALGHGFKPVNGHPDDDECTHRSDGTDATYCGEPASAHEAVPVPDQPRRCPECGGTLARVAWAGRTASYLGCDCGYITPRPVSVPDRPAESLDDVSADPVGAVRIWPRWQDEHHERGYALRWCSPLDRDEQYPWLLLDSDGPQRLGNDAVQGCERIELAQLAVELEHPAGMSDKRKPADTGSESNRRPDAPDAAEQAVDAAFAAYIAPMPGASDRDRWRAVVAAVRAADGHREGLR